VSSFRNRVNRVGMGMLLSVLSVGCGIRQSVMVPVDPILDARIASEVERRIAAEPLLDAQEILPRVEGARVHLHGSVDGIAAWSCAIRNAFLTEGVVAVVDFLVIERGPREGVCVAPRDPVRDRVAAP
jgi:hypothetical protein